MKKFILSLVAMTVLGTSAMSAQRNNRYDNSRYDNTRDSRRTEMRHESRDDMYGVGSHHGNSRGVRCDSRDNYRRGNRDVIVERNVVVRETARPMGHYSHRPVVVHESCRPIVVHESRRPIIVHESRRPVVVERRCSPSVGAVVAGAVVGAVVTSVLSR